MAKDFTTGGSEEVLSNELENQDRTQRRREQLRWDKAAVHGGGWVFRATARKGEVERKRNEDGGGTGEPSTAASRDTLARAAMRAGHGTRSHGTAASRTAPRARDNKLRWSLPPFQAARGSWAYSILLGRLERN